MKAVKINQEKGFTLLELLLVLSIVSIMTTIIISVGEKWIRTTSEQEAIDSLVATIQSMQSYAMANEVTTWVRFFTTDSRTEYVAEASGKGQFSRTYLPDGMEVSPDSYIKIVTFHPNGEIVNFGTLKILTKSKTIEIKFQFQHGRMIIGES